MWVTAEIETWAGRSLRTGSTAELGDGGDVGDAELSVESWSVTRRRRARNAA
jgi:hypothetical protein